MVKQVGMALFLWIAALGLAPCAYGGAWTQAKNGYYLKLGVNYLSTSEDIDASGQRIQKAGKGRLTDVSYSTYLEYGLLERLTVVASAPYRRLRDTREFTGGTTRERRTGFGDFDLRLRWLVARAPFIVSVGAGGKVPMWYAGDATTRVPLSTTEADGDARVLIGRSFHPFPGYATGELGYRVRGGPFSNELFYSLEMGVTVGRFLLKGYLAGIRTFGECVPSDEVLLVGNQSVVKVSPGAAYRLTDRLEVSVDLIHIVAGCNTTAGNTLSVGMAFKR